MLESHLLQSESVPFVDTKAMATVKKKVKPIAEQAENESRFMWKEVTAGLKYVGE